MNERERGHSWPRLAFTLFLAFAAGCSSSTLSKTGAAIAPDMKAWWRNGVCYEVFVRSFYDSDGDGIGDLRGLTARLDYINDGNPASAASLGANCI
ncbi:MAG TPA: hypothetical protein VE052_09165, partial [Gemmatimonadaceae bacterium]|nr:hypothetical protein [Gemmatimonadaceae bacterium]